MSKYFDILIDGDFAFGFNGSKETEARKFFKKTVKDNPNSDVKLVLHRRKVLRHNRPIE